MAQQQTEVGRRQGHDHLIFDFPVGASEVFKKAGGGFVSTDGSGRVEIASAAAVDIIGSHLFFEDFTASSTEGGTIVPVDMSLDSVYEIPIDTGTWADTMRGETCDIGVTSNVQGADLTASATDVLILIDKGFTDAAGTVQTVLVKLNVNALTLDAVV